MSVDDQAIVSAIAEWLEEARLALKARFGELVQLISIPSWQAQPTGGFKHYAFSPMYQFQMLDELLCTHSATWTNLQRLADDHANLKNHYTKFVNFSSGSGRSLSIKDLCISLLPNLRLEDDQLITADIEFNSSAIALKFIEAINDDCHEHLTVWPIHGIAIEGVLELDDLTEFRELTVEEKLHCLNFEIIRPMMQSEVASEHSRWFGLCRLTRDKKVFGIQESDGNDMIKRFIDQDQVLEDFLVSVPLTNNRVAFHAGGFAAAPHFEEGTTLKFGTFGRGIGASNHLRFAFLDDGTKLDAEESNRLREVWSFIRQTTAGKFSKRVSNAARRMFYAETRTKQDDALVDLIVAAESIYLSDNVELSFRTSLYASLWVDGDANRQREVFEAFRNAYNLRSKIVHGSAAPADKVAEAIQAVKPILRAAIRKALVHLSSNEQAPDWDSMVFGAGASAIGRHA